MNYLDYKTLLHKNYKIKYNGQVISAGAVRVYSRMV